MGRLLKLELKKAICSKYFLMGTGLLLLFALLSAWYMTENWMNYNPYLILNGSPYFVDGEYVANPDIALFSFYGAWVGNDKISLAAVVFFKMIPIAAAIPYAWTFCREYKSGYLKNVASRVNKKKYIIAKAIAVFISGALAILIPLVVNVLITSAFIPSIPPYVVDTLYNYITHGSLFADYYFNNPMLFVVLYIIFDAVYGGIFALLSFALSFYIKNVFFALFFPFMTSLVLGYLNSNLWLNLPGRIPRTINPGDFVEIIHLGGYIVWWVVLIVTAVLLVFIALTIWLKGLRNEIF